MATLEEQFNTRLTGFLEDTGMAPTTLGMLAVGDPNLLHQIERGRSLTLRTADRVVAFMDRYEVVAGSAEAVRLGGRVARWPQGCPGPLRHLSQPTPC